MMKDAVNTFYDYQKLRIALENGLRAGNYTNSEQPVFLDHYKRFEELEKEMLKYINELLKGWDIWKWLKKVKGIGPTIAGVIISEIDIYKAKTVSSIWKFAGLDVVDGHSPRPVKGQKLTYCKFLRSKLCGVLGPSFLKCNSPYRIFYDDYKYRLESKGWGKSKGHRHNAAIRYMIKMFLIDLYRVWREMEGLEVREPYNDEYGKGHHAQAVEVKKPSMVERAGKREKPTGSERADGVEKTKGSERAEAKEKTDNAERIFKGEVMDRYERNKKKARYCLGCIYLHIGTEVDHNHCDKTREAWNWMEQRANGRWKGRCHHKLIKH